MAIDTNTPTFVERDPAVIMAESKAKLEELLGRELQPAQVEQLILNFVVFRETLLVNRFNAGIRQMLYQFSTAPILDYIAGLVAVERLPAASAGCTVRFTLVAGHGSVLIPEGTRVSSSDGVAIFRTVDDAVIAPTTMTIELAVLADVAGKVGNGYAIGTINKILDPLAFVSRWRISTSRAAGPTWKATSSSASASSWRHRNIRLPALDRATSFTRKVPTP